MAVADTLAGACIANVGTTLPHSLAQPVSGHFPAVSHGGALACVYPPFLAFSWKGNPAKFARVARIFEPRLASSSDVDAAKACSEVLAGFLERIGITEGLGSVAGLEASMEVLVKEALDFPDTYVNPAVPTREEVIALYRASR
jgi:alcohol dehydrogenase class IV